MGTKFVTYNALQHLHVAYLKEYLIQVINLHLRGDYILSMLAVKWEKRETKLPLRFQAARYKYNKSVRNQTARDFLLVLFFYFPLKGALGNP